MKRIFYLHTCDTCKRIMKNLNLSDFEKREIKTQPITVKELESLQSITHSYASLFSKKAKLYKEMGLKDELLAEEDYKNYLLHHYTFLKRPIVQIGNKVFIGSDKKNIETLNNLLDA